MKPEEAKRSGIKRLLLSVTPEAIGAVLQAPNLEKSLQQSLARSVRREELFKAPQIFEGTKR
jgi:hypothetical protein